MIDTVRIGEHEYPSSYPPGKHWAMDAAWGILDMLAPGRLTINERTFLAGIIAGRLMKERDDERSRHHQDG
jgi:hypothetical protein